MEFDNAFDVPLPPAEAWTWLLDIERIATCLPGAELTEVVDAQTYKGKSVSASVPSRCPSSARRSWRRPMPPRTAPACVLPVPIRRGAAVRRR